MSGILRYAGRKPSLVSSDFRSENSTDGSVVALAVAPIGGLQMHRPGAPVSLLQKKKYPPQEAGKKVTHAVFYEEMEQLWKTVCARQCQKLWKFQVRRRQLPEYGKKRLSWRREKASLAGPLHNGFHVFFAERLCFSPFHPNLMAGGKEFYYPSF